MSCGCFVFLPSKTNDVRETELFKYVSPCTAIDVFFPNAVSWPEAPSSRSLTLLFSLKTAARAELEKANHC